jgi:hypothetical protein
LYRILRPNLHTQLPWENGCSEALIKSVKKSLVLAVGQSIMTFSELQTVMFEVANLLNERPIGTKETDPNEGSYLCPNDKSIYYLLYEFPSFFEVFSFIPLANRNA